MNLWSGNLAKPWEKLKLVYIHYCKVYCHNTWQDGNLPWAPFTHKVMWKYDHVV